MLSFSLSLLAALLGYAPAGEAQCVRGAVSCTNHTTMAQRTCSATVMCGGFPIATSAVIQANVANNVINCMPGSSIIASPVNFTAVAIANTSAPTTRTCGWNWRSGVGIATGTFSIDSGDGLPVELMDFSVQ